MVRAIRSDQTPNPLLLQYSSTWLVQNLILIPRFFFTESAIEQRPPLAATARRAGWVGCNILLTHIPPDGKITVITSGVEAQPIAVRREFARVRPVAQIPSGMRGWTLDVLNIIRRLDKPGIFA